MNGWSLDTLHALPVSAYDALNDLVEEMTRKRAED
jgi:hypothetical protein